MQVTNRKWLTKISPIVFLFLLTIVFFYPVIFEGKTFYAFDTLFQYLPWSSSVSNFRPHNPLITDPVNAFYPFHHFFKSCIEQKQLALWNDSNFCGVPFAATGISAPTNPIVFFFYIIFSLSTAHDVVLWFHLLGAGLFMFLYVKEIGLHDCPALIAAVSWMFNGYVMVWFEFEHIPILAFSLPASLYFAELWFRTREKLHSLYFTLAIGISICTGYAHGLMYEFIFIGSYLLYRYWQVKRDSKDVRKIGAQEVYSIGIAILLVGLISSNFFTSHLSLLVDKQRKGIPFGQLYQQTGQVPAKYLTTLLFPDFFGNPARQMCFTPRSEGAQPYNNYNELCIYSGILSLFLALACIPYFRKKYVRFFLLTAIVTIAMAMGSVLYYPLWKFVPGLNLSTPSRILFIFGFSMSALAAMGAEVVINADNKKKWFVFTLWTLLLSLGIMICFFVQTEEGARWAAGSHPWAKDWGRFYRALRVHFDISSEVIFKPMLLVFASFCVLCVAFFNRNKRFKVIALTAGVLILSYDLISFGLVYNTASPKEMEYPQTDAIRFLRKDKSEYRIITYGKFMHNSFAPFNIADVGGYASLYPRRYGEFLHLSTHDVTVPFPDQFSRWIRFTKFGSPLLDLINTKYVLLPPSSSVQMPKLKLVYDKEIDIYENKDAFPRLFIVPRYQVCNTGKKAYKTIGAYSLSDFRNKVVLESAPPKDFNQNNDGMCDEIESKINVMSYESSKIVAQVYTSQKGFMVISNSYHPGWKANVDGQEAMVLRANYIMSAIPIQAGNHEVELLFRPKVMIGGILVTALGWFILVGLIGVCVFERRKSDRYS